MYKFALGFSVVALAAVAVFVGHSPRTVVHAQSDKAALTMHTCPADVGTFGPLGPGNYTFNFCVDSVVTSGGPESATFHGQLIPGSTPPKSTFRDTTDWFCFFDDGQISTSQEFTITPSGNVEGECRVQ